MKWAPNSPSPPERIYNKCVHNKGERTTTRKNVAKANSVGGYAAVARLDL